MQLNLAQVSKLFAVPEATISLWVRQRNLPAHEVNSQYRFDRAELLEWAATANESFSPTIFREINGDHVAEISLADALAAGGVALNVPGEDRTTALREAIKGMTLPASLSSETLLALLSAREEAGGTAVGGGIAIPHARFPVIAAGSKPILRVCYLQTAWETAAADGQPIDTLFILVCPTVHEHLQLLARLTCVLQSSDFRKLLSSHPGETRLVSAVRAEEAAFAERDEGEQA